jgi:hypothetical protein
MFRDFRPVDGGIFFVAVRRQVAVAASEQAFATVLALLLLPIAARILKTVETDAP